MSEWDVNFIIDARSEIRQDLPIEGGMTISNNTDSNLTCKIEPNNPISSPPFSILAQYLIPKLSEVVYTIDNLSGTILIDNYCDQDIYLSILK